MTSEQFDAVIVGAGFGGIGAAIQLKRLGYDNFVILDREDDLGGTWHVNHYPGLAVDVPTTTYSYFFEPNPNWSRLFSTGRGDQAVRRRRRRQVRRAPAHAVQHHRRGRPLGRGRPGLAGRAGRRRDADRPVPDHRDRLPVPAEDARHPGHRPTSRARSSTPPPGTTSYPLDGPPGRPSSAPAPPPSSSSPSWPRRSPT